jgi:dTDP-4-dehydrorhamnose 3,5-epimerase
MTMLHDPKATWLLTGARKDEQSITADWEPVGRALIEGVCVRESRSVAKRNGSVTELYRSNWFTGADGVDQVFLVRLAIGGVSAWHAHATTVDRLSVIGGAATLALYDARHTSPTYGQVNEFLLHERRPMVVVVPPCVWHGVANTGDETCLLVNMPDHAYQYDDPDHWRLAAESAEIPYTFEMSRLRATDK